MDRTTKMTDAFVEVDFGASNWKTRTVMKTLNPDWNQEFSIDVSDDAQLQKELIEFKVWDHDVMSVGETIGVVYIDLNPLLMRFESESSDRVDGNWKVLSGWFPIYDTLQGIRGELNLTIRLVLFGAAYDKYSDSSLGVQFFSMSTLSPDLYSISKIHGMVEELTVVLDPEYGIADNFRTSRKSNEARQKLLYKLSSELKRQIGKKVRDMEGNAVLQYVQNFDIEGDSGIVARAIGTVATIVKVEAQNPEKDDLDRKNAPTTHNMDDVGSEDSHTVMKRSRSLISSSMARSDAPPLTLTALSPNMRSHSQSHAPWINNREEDNLSEDDESRSISRRSLNDRNVIIQQSVRRLGLQPLQSSEVQILTMTEFPEEIAMRLGGVVTSRSVKYLGRLGVKSADLRARDSWWIELREEVKSHARTLQCTFVVGYTETCRIHDDVCVLSATGTAAKLTSGHYDSGLLGPRPYNADVSASPWVSPSSTRSTGNDARRSTSPTLKSSLSTPIGKMGSGDLETNSDNAMAGDRGGAQPYFGGTIRRKKKKKKRCPAAVCHLAYKRNKRGGAPFEGMKIMMCAVCQKCWVPEVIFSTLEPPNGLEIKGEGILVEARVCRERPHATGDQDAINVSEAIPFLEYEMHRQVMVKMKMLGMNAAFGFRSQVHVGEQILVGIITATAVCLTALATPQLLEIRHNFSDKYKDDATTIVKMCEQNHRLLEKAGRRTMIGLTRFNYMVAYPDNEVTRRSPLGTPPSGNFPSRSQLSKDTPAPFGSPLLLPPPAARTGEKMRALSLTAQTMSQGGSGKYGSRGGPFLPTAAAELEGGKEDGYDGGNENEGDAGTVSALKALELAETDISSSSLSFETTMPVPPSPPDAGGGRSPSRSLERTSSFKKGRSSSKLVRAHSTSSTTSTDTLIHDQADGEYTSAPFPTSPFPIAAAKEDDSSSSSSSSSSESEKEDTILSGKVKTPFVVEIDDNDEDIASILLGKFPPCGVTIVNTETPPGSQGLLCNARMVLAIKRVKIKNEKRPTQWNKSLSLIFHQMYASIVFKLRHCAPCVICKFQPKVTYTADDHLELIITGMAVSLRPPQLVKAPLMETEDDDDGHAEGEGEGEHEGGEQENGGVHPATAPLLPENTGIGGDSVIIEAPLLVPRKVAAIISKNIEAKSVQADKDREDTDVMHKSKSVEGLSIDLSSSGMAVSATAERELKISVHKPQSPLSLPLNLRHSQVAAQLREVQDFSTAERDAVQLTPLTYIPGHKIVKYVGRINLHFVKESMAVRGYDGLGKFFHLFLTEAHAIAKSQVLLTD
jgi:hypothetical protein